MFQIDLKKCLRLKKLETLFRGHMLLVILKANKLLIPRNKSKRIYIGKSNKEKSQ